MRRVMARGERCAIHKLALGPEGQCVLCRRTSAPPPRRSLAPVGGQGTGGEAGRSLWWLFGLLLFAGVGAFVLMQRSSRDDDGSGASSAEGAEQAQAQANEAPTNSESATREGAKPADATSTSAAALEGTLQTKNRWDRSGAYLIPSGASLPLVVAFHGSGGSGAGLLAELRALALRHEFAVVAPDAGFISEAGTYTWYVAHERGDSSADSAHIAAAIDEVLALAGERIAPVGWLALGHSGGASSAPYLATHDARFAAFAVLHGGAFPNAFGPLRPRGWFSTGSTDPARPPAHVSAQAEAAARVLGAQMVETHVFAGGHALLPDELEGVMSFWRGGAR